ncbi:Os07g0484401 [Oryza sativa Japonica Group]|uniref:Os07g0484401 protein n=1 Tax=Oryza sativa subsp. japonica TaxID=39947 RepID=A0A0P0X660_ORYSJ|nr:hypothetical protein EE612_039254 [Oryza sativa]BAT01507.1 Os07g0484401 [Oryza sativa Japonica Group]
MVRKLGEREQELNAHYIKGTKVPGKYHYLFKLFWKLNKSTIPDTISPCKLYPTTSMYWIRICTQDQHFVV